MKLLPTLLVTLGLLASPALLAEEQKAATPAHGEPGHNHETDHGQDAHKGESADEHAKHDEHKGESAEDHAKHEQEGHDHAEDDKPHHGGIVADVDGIHHELVMAEDGKVSLYAEGLPEGDALSKVKVRLTILKGKDKQEAEMLLAEGDAHRFDAPPDVKLAAGDKVVALIQPLDGKPRMAKFDIPAAE
ncbi:hypothetical protein RCF98_13675 [Thiothrix lacustris]|jgi:hypothetical protein|uniref:Uncharacterized protein n=1 Tax=Thiothrix lacustris TaxID=525917 RepID=A0ABY9MNA2_9GAMM|nr:hypothetical protein [Thiothrix lacustris]WML90012.1 hypothetical protein RCF98_13675 [Thiothrix lacustris]